MACGRSSNIRTLIAVAETVSSCQASWCCSGRSLLRALLHPADSAPCFACCAVLRAALDGKDATALLIITTFSHLRLVGAHHCCLLNLALANAGCRSANPWRRDATCSSILLQTIGFSSGAISGGFISTPGGVLLVATSYRFHSRARCSADLFPVSILTTESCRVRGQCSSKILRSIPRLTLSIFTLSPAHYIQCETFRFWPNFWQNDTSR